MEASKHALIKLDFLKESTKHRTLARGESLQIYVDSWWVRGLSLAKTKGTKEVWSPSSFWELERELIENLPSQSLQGCTRKPNVRVRFQLKASPSSKNSWERTSPAAFSRAEVVVFVAICRSKSLCLWGRSNGVRYEFFECSGMERFIASSSHDVVNASKWLQADVKRNDERESLLGLFPGLTSRPPTDQSPCQNSPPQLLLRRHRQTQNPHCPLSCHHRSHYLERSLPWVLCLAVSLD